MNTLLLWAALAVVSFGSSPVDIGNAAGGTDGCGGCCITGECRCPTCACPCCDGACTAPAAAAACCGCC